MTISFIVLTYNRVDALLAVLTSLADQCGAGHEVLIADDGSRPEQVDMLKKNCPVFNCPVRHIWHPDIGFTAAAARNLAISQATGDYLIFLDGDCVPNHHFVQSHQRLAESGMFVNGSRVLLSERLTNKVLAEKIVLPHQRLWFWIKARISGDANKLLHFLGWPSSLFRVKQGFIWRGIRSCNMGVWRADMLAANGFDESFTGWGHEDADLVLRLSHLGICRKDGFFATEVYHLWHSENARDHESSNHKVVSQRMQTDLVMATKGLAQISVAESVRISVLQ
ncbi:Chondroitin synthase [Polaromonas vacuolata]|uniref:Chondroitin synthase n=1 Tax=Polaromonas vacuolata TaxID=37448 RepID=A0A6H2HAP5_9BURK|nr:glycosyltransferase family 2 protein [Polaromonas vacuolata]QJC56546.1 Chondroitin synthase [Polaromonas vacuolata]